MPHLTFRCIQNEFKWHFVPGVKPVKIKVQFEESLSRDTFFLHHDKKLIKESPDLMGGGGCRARTVHWTISVAVPLTISFSVSEAITGQQSTTAVQLSCLWFLIKTKRRDPSKTLFAFQAIQVIIFIMDTIIMSYEKWSHYYSHFQIIRGRHGETKQVICPSLQFAIQTLLQLGQ